MEGNIVVFCDKKSSLEWLFKCAVYFASKLWLELPTYGTFLEAENYCLELSAAVPWTLCVHSVKHDHEDSMFLHTSWTILMLSGLFLESGFWTSLFQLVCWNWGHRNMTGWFALLTFRLNPKIWLWVYYFVLHLLLSKSLLMNGSCVLCFLLGNLPVFISGRLLNMVLPCSQDRVCDACPNQASYSTGSPGQPFFLCINIFFKNWS